MPGWKDWFGPSPGQFSPFEATAAAPGAGSTPAINVAAGEWWRLVQVACTLTTSAVVASRRARLILTATGGNFLDVYANGVQLAGTTHRYLWTRGVGAPYTEATLALVVHMLPLPDFIVPPGQAIQIAQENLDAGDTWGITTVVYEQAF